MIIVLLKYPGENLQELNRFRKIQILGPRPDEVIQFFFKELPDCSAIEVRVELIKGVVFKAFQSQLGESLRDFFLGTLNKSLEIVGVPVKAEQIRQRLIVR